MVNIDLSSVRKSFQKKSVSSHRTPSLLNRDTTSTNRNLESIPDSKNSQLTGSNQGPNLDDLPTPRMSLYAN
jgi:hypothetical protein